MDRVKKKEISGCQGSRREKKEAAGSSQGSAVVQY